MGSVPSVKNYHVGQRAASPGGIFGHDFRFAVGGGVRF
jgi:hypothetical protein